MDHQTVITLFLGIANASWGEWDRSAYCDFTYPKVGREEISAEYFYSNEECSFFCETTDQNDVTIKYGDQLCCDYESWEDGTYTCSLYNTGVTLSNDYPTTLDAEGNPMGNDFQSMVFASGDYRYGVDEYVENVKATMIDSGCSETCVDNVLTADPTQIESVASDCGCPVFM